MNAYSIEKTRWCGYHCKTLVRMQALELFADSDGMAPGVIRRLLRNPTKLLPPPSDKCQQSRETSVIGALCYGLFGSGGASSALTPDMSAPPSLPAPLLHKMAFVLTTCVARHESWGLSELLFTELHLIKKLAGTLQAAAQQAAEISGHYEELHAQQPRRLYLNRQAPQVAKGTIPAIAIQHGLSDRAACLLVSFTLCCSACWITCIIPFPNVYSAYPAGLSSPCPGWVTSHAVPLTFSTPPCGLSGQPHFMQLHASGVLRSGLCESCQFESADAKARSGGCLCRMLPGRLWS